MSCGKGCGWGCGKVAMLCPVSLGIAVGVVSFFAVFLWSLWVMKYGMPPMMEALHMPVPTLMEAFTRSLLALLKGFLFGFFVAFIYDLIRCCCNRKKVDDGSCQCNCHVPSNKTGVGL